MTPLPISTITKVFHPRIVPIPNALITELRITEMFYYGLLLPNVAHSFEGVQKTFARYHHQPVPKIYKFFSYKILVQLNSFLQSTLTEDR